MKAIGEWFDEYAVNHQNEKNKLIHFICVPSIYFSMVGLLSCLPSISLYKLFPSALEPFAHFGTFAIIFAMLFYVRLSVPIMLGMLVFSLLCLLLINLIHVINFAPVWLVSLIIFVIAWIGQFYGHKEEGSKPSFTKDVQFLLIGPAWILGFVYRKLGINY
jgi:uncharacterized membrane protein YGL010W